MKIINEDNNNQIKVSDIISELGFKDGFYDSEVYMTVNDPVITDYINKVIKGENLVYSVFLITKKEEFLIISMKEKQQHS